MITIREAVASPQIQKSMKLISILGSFGAFWTPRTGRSYKMPSVCMYVCMYVCLYVCHSPPALTTPTISLIFGMKVGDH